MLHSVTSCSTACRTTIPFILFPKVLNAKHSKNYRLSSLWGGWNDYRAMTYRTKSEHFTVRPWIRCILYANKTLFLASEDLKILINLKQNELYHLRDDISSISRFSYQQSRNSAKSSYHFCLESLKVSPETILIF